MEVKTKKRKSGERQLCLFTIIFQFPDFTEDNNLTGGCMAKLT